MRLSLHQQPVADAFLMFQAFHYDKITNLINTVATVKPTTKNNAWATAASKKKKPNAKPNDANKNPKVPKKKGRKPYERDENGKIIRPPNKTTVQNSENK